MAKDSLFHSLPKLGHQVIVFGYNNELQSKPPLTATSPQPLPLYNDHFILS